MSNQCFNASALCFQPQGNTTSENLWSSKFEFFYSIYIPFCKNGMNLGYTCTRWSIGFNGQWCQQQTTRKASRGLVLPNNNSSRRSGRRLMMNVSAVRSINARPCHWMVDFLPSFLHLLYLLRWKYRCRRGKRTPLRLFSCRFYYLKISARRKRLYSIAWKKIALCVYVVPPSFLDRRGEIHRCDILISQRQLFLHQKAQSIFTWWGDIYVVG